MYYVSMFFFIFLRKDLFDFCKSFQSPFFFCVVYEIV